MEQVPDIEGKDPSPYQLALERQAQLDRATRHIMQQIIGETSYKADLEWTVWHESHRIEEENGLPDGVTAEGIFQHYLKTYEGEL